MRDTEAGTKVTNCSSSYSKTLLGPARKLIARRGHPSLEFHTWTTMGQISILLPCEHPVVSETLSETLRRIQKGKKIPVDKLRDFRYKTPGSALRGVNPRKPTQFLKVHTKAIWTRIRLSNLHMAACNSRMKMGSLIRFRRIKSLRSWSQGSPSSSLDVTKRLKQGFWLNTPASLLLVMGRFTALVTYQRS